MKSQITFLVLIILFTFSQFTAGQEKPKAKLVNELSYEPCERIRSSLDNLMRDLLDESESKGYIVISGDKSLETVNAKEWVDGQFKYRKFDEERWVTVKDENSKEYKIQMWKVPKGAEMPFSFKREFDYSLSLRKPLLFYGLEEGNCPEADHYKMFCDFLRANPNLRGNVVVYEKTLNQFRKIKRELLKKSISISPNRLRFFSRKSSYSFFQLWLIPKN